MISEIHTVFTLRSVRDRVTINDVPYPVFLEARVDRWHAGNVLEVKACVEVPNNGKTSIVTALQSWYYDREYPKLADMMATIWRGEISRNTCKDNFSSLLRATFFQDTWAQKNMPNGSRKWSKLRC